VASSDDELIYRNVKTTREEVEGFPIIVAETSGMREGGVVREHQRIFAAKGTASGHPLLYIDSYSGNMPDATFAYARHSESQTSFLDSLAVFYETLVLVQYSELLGREAHAVVQTNGSIGEQDYESFPSAFEQLRLETLRFVRLYFPFGDITAEFGEQAISDNELVLTEQNSLPRRTEFPLFAFDVSRTSIWTSFLAEIHWAKTLINPSVLRAVLKLATRITT
jgi:hypothetical protein